MRGVLGQNRVTDSFGLWGGFGLRDTSARSQARLAVGVLTNIVELHELIRLYTIPSGPCSTDALTP